MQLQPCANIAGSYARMEAPTVANIVRKSTQWIAGDGGDGEGAQDQRIGFQ